MTFTYRHKKEIILCISIVALLLVLGVFLTYKKLNPPKNSSKGDIVLNTKSDVKKKEEKEDLSTDSSDDIYFQVDIKGQVNSPGIYTVKKGSRVIDVIRLAGDLTNIADTSVINLSKKVTDEMVIIVYSYNEVANFEKTMEVEEVKQESCLNQNGIQNDACITDSKEEEKDENNKGSSVVIDGKISINTATKEELMTLTGIGEAKALAIIRYREKEGSFQKIEEIKKISGIGDAVFDKIKENITI